MFSDEYRVRILTYLDRPDVRTQSRCWKEWRCAGREPTLAAMIDDPIVRLLIDSDGLTPADVRRLVEMARRGVGMSAGHRPAAP